MRGWAWSLVKVKGLGFFLDFWVKVEVNRQKSKRGEIEKIKWMLWYLKKWPVLKSQIYIKKIKKRSRKSWSSWLKSCLILIFGSGSEKVFLKKLRWSSKSVSVIENIGAVFWRRTFKFSDEINIEIKFRSRLFKMSVVVFLNQEKSIIIIKNERS